MQIVIDISEDDYKEVQEDTYSGTPFENRVFSAIANGTLLDDIKAEIKQWYWQADKQALAKDPCVVDAMIDLFIRTIDNHIGKEQVNDNT